MKGKNALRLVEYLSHIVEAVGRIQAYIADLKSEQEFYENTLVQDAVIRNLEIIGEASNNVDKHFPQFVQDHKDVPFIYAYEMRNALAHGYFKVDLPIVWQTIENDLPALASSVQKLIESIE